MGLEFGQASAGPHSVGFAGVELQVPGLGGPRWLPSPACAPEGTARPLPLQLVPLQRPLREGGQPYLAQDSESKLLVLERQAEPVTASLLSPSLTLPLCEGLPDGHSIRSLCQGTTWASLS